jgi:hypothetical protein
MVNYFYILKTRHHLFHGDIKLNNLFFDINGSGLITSDSGSLLMVNPNETERRYKASTYNS